MTTKEFNENELLFNELYERTKDCGRVQFINLLMEKERENQDLKKQLSNSHQMKNQQKEFIKWLEKLAYQDMVASDFANGCKVAYGITLNRYKELVGGKK